MESGTKEEASTQCLHPGEVGTVGGKVPEGRWGGEGKGGEGCVGRHSLPAGTRAASSKGAQGQANRGGLSEHTFQVFTLGPPGKWPEEPALRPVSRTLTPCGRCFQPVLTHVQMLWELMLLGEPLVVLAPSPAVSSEMVLALTR